MRANEYLSQVKDIDLRIRSLEGELSDCDNEADEEYARELRSRIFTDIEQYKQLKLRIREEIQALADNQYSTLLSEYYIRGRSWEQVADAIGKKDIKNVRENIHRRACEAFAIAHPKYFFENTP